MSDYQPDAVDILAAEIRRVDGNHDLGAGALAAALMPWIRAAQAEALRDIALHYRRSMKIARDDRINAALMIRFVEGRADEIEADDINHPEEPTA